MFFPQIPRAVRSSLKMLSDPKMLSESNGRRERYFGAESWTCVNASAGNRCGCRHGHGLLAHWIAAGCILREDLTASGSWEKHCVLYTALFWRNNLRLLVAPHFAFLGFDVNACAIANNLYNRHGNRVYFECQSMLTILPTTFLS